MKTTVREQDYQRLSWPAKSMGLARLSVDHDDESP